MASSASRRIAALARHVGGATVQPVPTAATSEPATTQVSLDEVKELTRLSVKAQGWEGRDLDLIVDVILYAQFRGNNQGLIKLVTGGIPKAIPATAVKLLKDTPVSALLDGGQRMGMLVLKRAMDIAQAKASKLGVGIVGTVNTSSSTGAIGYYARHMAERGLIGLVFAQSPELVCPYGTHEAYYGTNPLAIGIPRAGAEPIVLDMATSAIAYYGVLEAAQDGRKIPGDVALNPHGKATTDPNAALDGGLLSFDRSHKGSALGLVVELLTGAWVGGALVDKMKAANWGNLIMAIDPSILRSGEEVKARVGLVAEHIKGLKRLPGVPQVCMPGERGSATHARHKQQGYLTLNSSMVAKLRAQRL